MSTPGRQLDPRLHLAAAIGWAVFVLVTLAALVAAQLASRQAEQRARADAQGLLAEFATQVRDALSMALDTRRSMLRATATQIASSAERDPDALRRTLLAARAKFPEFAWLGLADADGTVVADTASPTLRTNVSALPWFQQGSTAAYVSDRHVDVVNPDGPPPDPARRRPALIDAAAPLRDGRVLGAFLAWAWVDQQMLRMQQVLNQSRQMQLLLVARDGQVLFGPPAWTGHSVAADSDLTEGGDQMIGSRAHFRLADDLGLGWTVVVRQRADLALAPARATGRMVFLIVFVAGLLAAAMAVLATRLLTRRLTRLAADAEAVRTGASHALAAPAGNDEVARIGATLSQVVDHLLSEKRALQTLNTELDRRVADRTQRIERMAHEARRAAVTLERLRIARDLHDTLAQSLMALLTQIRLVRKLRARLSATELDDELARAEDVATKGLAESRAAIAQMRDNGVREAGLGAAVQDLARRFGERTGITATLTADEAVARSTDERAETVFRIIEEALRNIERHAGARAVQLSLRGCAAQGDGGTGVSVDVIDDGVGFDPATPRPGHYGLRGIREQALLIGARLDVSSQPGQGTRISLAFDA